ncbi:MAG: hypothetical protein ACRDSF_07100, partial [Pseudonocardiaceae bacterium]
SAEFRSAEFRSAELWPAELWRTTGVAFGHRTTYSCLAACAADRSPVPGSADPRSADWSI